MEKLKVPNFKANRAVSYTFYQIPKELITNKIFKDVDYSSKILYGLLLNRVSLSAQNPDFTDKNGDVYIIYTIEQIIEDMSCSRPTAVNMLKQLDNIGLIEKKRLGQGKPSLIYVKDFGAINFEKSKILTSKNQKFLSDKVKNFDCSNNDPIKNDLSKISIHPAQAETGAPHQIPDEPEPIDTIDNQANKESPVKPLKPDLQNPEDSLCESQPYKNYTSGTEAPEITKDALADKIGFSDLLSEHPDKEAKISELCDIVCEVLETPDTNNIRVAKRQLPAVTVKQEFSKLTKEHFLYVLDCLEKNAGNIKGNAKGYLLTSLYNSIHSIGFYKPKGKSAFAFSDKPKSNSGYNVEDFFFGRGKSPVYT